MTKKIVRSKGPLTVRCEDCSDEWSAHRAGKCPLCGGRQIVVDRKSSEPRDSAKR